MMIEEKDWESTGARKKKVVRAMTITTSVQVVTNIIGYSATMAADRSPLSARLPHLSFSLLAAYKV
jgi:hypothetical protein